MKIFKSNAAIAALFFALNSQFLFASIAPYRTPWQSMFADVITDELEAVDIFIVLPDLDYSDVDEEETEVNNYIELVVDEADSLSRRETPIMDVLPAVDENYTYSEESPSSDGCLKPNSFLTTKLHLAAMQDDFATIFSCVEVKDLIDAQDYNGDTALHYAVREEHLCSVFALLCRGASAAIKNNQGLSALDSARKLVGGAMSHLIRTLSSNPARARQEYDFLVDVYRNPHTINEVGLFGRTHLFQAAQRGFVAATAILIQDGLQIDHRDEDGKTPLHYAVNCQKDWVGATLIAAGANVNTLDNLGLSPLYNAVYHKSDWMVELLISHGAQVNIADNEGMTALHHSALRGLTRTTRILLENGAKSLAVDHHGYTASMLIEDSGFPAISRLLHDAEIKEAAEQDR